VKPTVIAIAIIYHTIQQNSVSILVFDSEDRSDMFLRNVVFSAKYTVSLARRRTAMGTSNPVELGLF
jgi:hypothetical protein